MAKKNYFSGLAGDDIHHVIAWKLPTFHQKRQIGQEFHLKKGADPRRCVWIREWLLVLEKLRPN